MSTEIKNALNQNAQARRPCQTTIRYSPPTSETHSAQHDTVQFSSDHSSGSYVFPCPRPLDFLKSQAAAPGRHSVHGIFAIIVHMVGK